MQGTPETHEQGATMNQTDLLAAADQYLAEQWPAMVDDIAQLCAVLSLAEHDRAAPGGAVSAVSGTLGSEKKCIYLRAEGAVRGFLRYNEGTQ